MGKLTLKMNFVVSSKSDCRSRGREFSVNNILFKYKVHGDTTYIQYNTFERDTVASLTQALSHTLVAIDREIISMVILLLPLIQEGLWSITSESTVKPRKFELRF